MPDAAELDDDLPLESSGRSCRVCSCNDDHACEGGCTWLSDTDDLCSACVAAQPHVVSMTIDHGTDETVGTCRCGWVHREKRYGSDHIDTALAMDMAITVHWYNQVEAAHA